MKRHSANQKETPIRYIMSTNAEIGPLDRFRGSPGCDAVGGRSSDDVSDYDEHGPAPGDVEPGDVDMSCVACSSRSSASSNRTNTSS